MRQSILILLFAALSLGCAAKQLPSEPQTAVSPVGGAGEQRITDQIILLTDASGTMYGARTFPEAKAVTQSLIAALPDGNVQSSLPKPYQAGFIGFGGTARHGSPVGSFDRSALANSANSLELLGSITGRGGETPYRHVLNEASQALSGKSGRAALVITSDGMADYGDEALASAQALVSAYDGEVCIHTIHTGDETSGAAFLTRLSSLTSCGTSQGASSVRSAGGLTAFMRTVMLGAAPVVETRAAPDPCEQVVRLRGVEFEFDKANLTEDSLVVLDVAADQLRACANVAVRVEGHTDHYGTDAYNQGLSERRANSVKNYLVSKGVGGGRLAAKGMGEGSPIADGGTDEGRARNRRVELHPVQ